MTYEAGERFICEHPKRPVFDTTGRPYQFKVEYFYDDSYDCQAIFVKLIRMGRDCEVGRAYCLLKTPTELEIADLIIDNAVDFLSLDDKIFKLFHWNEPSNYRRLGLGTALLRFVIDLARNKRIQCLYGTLVEQDIQENSNLVRWFQQHGFRIEPSNREDKSNVVARVRLDFN